MSEEDIYNDEYDESFETEIPQEIEDVELQNYEYETSRDSSYPLEDWYLEEEEKNYTYEIEDMDLTTKIDFVMALRYKCKKLISNNSDVKDMILKMAKNGEVSNLKNLRNC